MDWLEGVWNKLKGERDHILYTAWAYGAAARTAIVSAMSENVQYPTTYKDLWNIEGDELDTVDGQPDTRTQQEKEDAAWMMDRDLLIMQLQAAQERGGS